MLNFVTLKDNQIVLHRWFGLGHKEIARADIVKIAINPYSARNKDGKQFYRGRLSVIYIDKNGKQKMIQKLSYLDWFYTDSTYSQVQKGRSNNLNRQKALKIIEWWNENDQNPYADTRPENSPETN